MFFQFFWQCMADRFFCFGNITNFYSSILYCFFTIIYAQNDLFFNFLNPIDLESVLIKTSVSSSNVLEGDIRVFVELGGFKLFFPLECIPFIDALSRMANSNANSNTQNDYEKLKSESSGNVVNNSSRFPSIVASKLSCKVLVQSVSFVILYSSCDITNYLSGKSVEAIDFSIGDTFVVISPTVFESFDTLNFRKALASIDRIEVSVLNIQLRLWSECFSFKPPWILAEPFNLRGTFEFIKRAELT